MKYMINFNEWGDMFSVPSSVVDNHLKISSEVQIKVLLYIMRNNKIHPDDSSIAQALSISRQEAENAISFWIDRKILISQNTQIQHIETQQDDKFDPVVKPRPKPAKRKVIKPDSQYVAKKLREDRNIAGMLEEAQQVLKKTLSPNDISCLIYFNDSLGLPCPVIVMILHYCAGIDRRNMSYIEKMAIEWSDEEIFSLEAAENKLKQMSNAQNAWDKVSKWFGLKMITRPTKTQVRYANTWIFDWNMPKDLINEAYERCIDVKHSFDMSYINGILKKWHEKGIKNLKELKDLDESTKPASKTKQVKGKSKNKGSVYESDTASYNLDDYVNKSIFDDEDE